MDWGRATVTELDRDLNCEGLDKCHGAMKWCDFCGSVAEVCDVRDAGLVCSEHPAFDSFEVEMKRVLEANRAAAQARRVAKDLEEAALLAEERWRAGAKWWARKHKRDEEEEARFFGTADKKQTSPQETNK